MEDQAVCNVPDVVPQNRQNGKSFSQQSVTSSNKQQE